MQSSNHRPEKVNMLSYYAVETNYKLGNSIHYPSMHSADKLFQHALQNMDCLKEAAKAPNSRQADTVK